MIQPISTLRDHNNVFQLQTPDNLRKRRNPSAILEEEPDPGLPAQDPETDIDQARQNVVRSMENQKINNLNDFLLSPPEKPEIDQKMIDKNRNLARKAALIQVLDSIGDTVQLNRNQDEAVVAPTRFGDLGLSALDNIRNLDQEHKVDLRRYNQRKDQVDQFNRQTTQKANQFNAGVDTNIARMEYDTLLEQETQQALAADKEKERYYEAGLRSISNKDTKAADFYLQRAGLGSDEINRLKGVDGKGLDISPQNKALYEEYQHYQRQADYEEDFDRMEGEIKPYSPTWHMQRIMEELGSDFYHIDREMRRLSSNEYQGMTEAEQQQVKDRFPNTGQVLQKTLISNILQATDEQTRKQAASDWLTRNTEFLKSEGIPEDQIDQLNEQMFVRMIQELGGAGNETDQPAEQRVNLAGMGSGRTDTTDQPPEAEPDNDNQPDQRESLPQHLRNTYDIGNKYLEQKRRVEMIESRNPNFNASFGRREEQRLRQQLIDRLNRLQKPEDRQALIDALGFNPLED